MHRHHLDMNILSKVIRKKNFTLCFNKKRWLNLSVTSACQPYLFIKIRGDFLSSSHTMWLAFDDHKNIHLVCIYLGQEIPSSQSDAPPFKNKRQWAATHISHENLFFFITQGISVDLTLVFWLFTMLFLTGTLKTSAEIGASFFYQKTWHEQQLKRNANKMQRISVVKKSERIASTKKINIMLVISSLRSPNKCQVKK